MKIMIRGWRREPSTQTIFSKSVMNMETRSDNIVVPSGCTINGESGTEIGMLAKISCSKNFNYMLIIDLSDSELVELVVRRSKYFDLSLDDYLDRF